MYGMGAQGGILFKAVLNDFGMETCICPKETAFYT